MTDDWIDDIVATTARIDDARLRSPALRAAVRAAVEDLTHVPSSEEHPDPDGQEPPAEPSYLRTGAGGSERHRPWRLAVAAAAVLVLTATAGVIGLRDGGDREERRTSSADEPEAPTTTQTVPPTTGCVFVPPTGAEPGDVTPLTSTVPDRPGTSSSTTATSNTTSTTSTSASTTETTEPLVGGCQPLPQSTFPGPDGERTPPDPSEAPPADAPLPERIHFAYRVAYLDNIEHTFTTDSRNGGQTYEMWRDDRTGTWRDLTTGGNGSLHGKPYLDGGPSGFDGDTPTGRRSIDHCFSEYTEQPEYGPRNNVTVPVRFKRDVDAGQLVVDGTEVVDGREAIRLKHNGYDETTWLDAATLLPFRTAGTYGDGGRYTITHEFLPRTEANRQLLVPPIPQGFTEGGASHGDGEALGKGC